MSKRERHLKQRLEELFSSEPAPAEEAGPAESTQAARATAQAAAAQPRSVGADVKTVIEQMPVPVYVKDREHNWVALNAAFSQRLGQPASALIGHVDKEQADEDWHFDDQVLESGQTDEEQKSTTLPDGSIRTMRTRRVPLFDGQHQITGLMGIIHETVTPSEVSRVAENDAAFRLALESMSDPMLISRVVDDAIVFANAALSDLAGAPLDKLIGQPVTQLYLDPANRQELAEMIRRQGAVQDYEARLRHPAGRILWVSLNMRPLRFNGEPCVIANLTDITARKAAETDLLKFKLGIDRAYVSVMITDINGKILYVNPAFSKIYGYTSDEAVGKKPNLLKSGRITPEQYQRFWNSLLDGQIVTGEIINKTKDGRLIPVETNNSPILDENGKIIGFLSMQADISERKQAEAERERLLNGEARRALQMQTAAAISNAVSTVLNLDELLPFVVNLIQERFALYYVGLFLINSAEPQADLRAGTGEAGQQMLARRYHLRLTEDSMIGWCIANRQARIALDVGQDATHFSNPFLPETRSEVALPLISRGQVLGAMTAQSREAAAFSDQDVAVLQSMADQVANAIANAQLFEQSRAAQAKAEARLREVQFLQRVSEASSATLNPERVYDVVFEALEKEMGFAHTALLIFDETADAAVVARAAGIAIGMQGLVRRMSDLQNDIVMDIARKGEIEVIDGWDDRFDREIYERERHDRLVRAFVPLNLRGVSVGLLEVGYERAKRARITDDEIRLLSSLADQIAISVANAQLFEETQRRVTEMSILNEISQAFSVSQGSEQLFETIHAQVGRLFDMRNFYIATYDGGDKWTSAYHIENGERRPEAVYPLGSGFTSHILRTQQPILIHSAAENQTFHAEHGLQIVGDVAKSWMGVPLLVSGRAIGVMGLQSYERENLYHDHDLMLFSTIAAQATIALQNTRLYEEARLRADELAALNELSRALTTRLNMNQVLEEIHHGVARLLDATNFYVALYDAERNEVTFPIDTSQSDLDREIEVMPADQGLTGYIIQTRSSLLIKDDLEGWLRRMGIEMKGEIAQSWLGVPLLSGGQVLGVIALQSYTTARVYDEHDQAILASLAGQAAIAVQNAQLFERTQKNAREMAALNEFSRTISQQTEVIPMLEATYQKLRALLPIDAFRIGLYDESSKLITYPVIHDGRQRFEDISEPLNPESGIGRAILSGKPELILLTAEELAQITGVPYAMGSVDKPSASLLYVPMQVGQRVIGALSAQSNQLNAYTEDDLRLIGAVANQVAIALQNVRLFEETRQRNAELATLNQIIGSASQTLDLHTLLDMVLRQTLELFRFDGGLITIYNETRHKLERVVRIGLPGEIPSDPAEGLENSLCSYVFDSKKPLVIEDFRNGAPIDVSGEIEAGYYSYIGIPLEARGRTLGTWCGFRKFAGPFGTNTLTLLQAVGHQVSFAIENARLFDETRARVHREQTLREITARVRSSMDPEVIVRTAVQDLGQALNRPAFIRLGSAEDLTLKAAPKARAEANDGQGSTPQGGK